MANEIKWNDRFCIGVDSIDSAHQRLFSIVGKLLSLNEDETKQQHACREGIKYFKSYALKHFADEEAYMASIGYPGLAMHKKLHDNMRDKTLPALEDELNAQNFSKESVRHFLGICIGWLNAHIMIEDYAITGKARSKWEQETPENEADALTGTLGLSIGAMCHANVRVISQHYGCEDFATGKTLCYRLNYIAKDRSALQLYFVYEEALVLKTLSEILDQEFLRLDQTATSAMKILSEQLAEKLRPHFSQEKKYLLERNDLMTLEQFSRTFDKTYPPYSILFGVENKGYCAVCAK